MRKQIYSASLKPRLHQDIVVQGKLEGLNFSQMLERMAEYYLSEVEKKESARPESFEQFKEYFLVNGFPAELAHRAFMGYDAAGWKDSKGKRIKNWRQKCQHVWFKPENKSKSSSDSSFN